MTFDEASFRSQLRITLDAHARAFDRPPEAHALLRRQIEAGDAIHDRRTFPGHVTTSAIILDRSGQNTLLIRHRSLSRWLQPGGHYEPPDELAVSALREASEETGLQGLALDPWHHVSGLPIDIDTHRIPARPERGEPDHWHHDIRYVVRADMEARLQPDLAEVEGATWHPVSELERLAPQALNHMRRLGLVRT
jgi:8-oxo-dGTP pyrophosphatase MutT (NUDIX family)